MVIITIVLLLALTLKTGNFSLGEKGYTVKVQFHNIDGVNSNSPVMYNGYEVGFVKGIAVKNEGQDTKMELTLWLRDEVRLREGDRVMIKFLGLMGEKYIGIISAKNCHRDRSPP